MIIGVGNDIIEVHRIRAAINRYESRFLNRVFTKKEQEYCLKYKDPAKNFAGRFAAKEAFVKAIGTGFGEGVSWLDIEITNDENGKPIIEVSKELQKRCGDGIFSLSISHCQEYATAVVIHSK